MPTLRVLLFGHYRDICPDPLTLEIARGETVADVAARLAARDARLSELLARTRVAVGAEFVAPDTVLRENDEVAFLPPMSGG